MRQGGCQLSWVTRLFIGACLASVLVTTCWAYPAVNRNVVNWTTPGAVGFTIGFNETVSNVTIYFGTENPGSLTGVKFWNMSDKTDTVFYPIITGLASNTTYNFTVHPNVSIAGWNHTGNFTTRAGIYNHFEYAFDNSSYFQQAGSNNLGGQNMSNISSPFDPYMQHWWSDTGEAWTSTEGSGAGFDSASTGDLYFQSRIGWFDDDDDGLVTQDQGSGIAFWSTVGAGEWSWRIFGFNDSARDAFEWWAHDFTGGWERLVGQEPISLNTWYNVTVRVDNDCRYSVLGADEDYYVQIDGNGSTGPGSWYGPFGISEWVNDGELHNQYIEAGGDLDAYLCQDLSLVQNATFLSGTAVHSHVVAGAGNTSEAWVFDDDAINWWIFAYAISTVTIFISLSGGVGETPTRVKMGLLNIFVGIPSGLWMLQVQGGVVNGGGMVLLLSIIYVFAHMGIAVANFMSGMGD